MRMSLKVNKDKSTVLKIENGNNREIQMQEIEFTDFPLEQIEIWFSEGLAYLPSEH